MSEALTVIIFISLGFILLLIELFTPGFAVAGILGILLLILGSYQAYLKLSLFWGIAVSIASLLIVVGFFKLLTHSLIWKGIRLESKETKDQGFTSGEDLSSLLNKQGMTLSALRPSGIALIDNQRIDVTAESLFIDKNKKIRVIKVEGNKVIVQEEV